MIASSFYIVDSEMSVIPQVEDDVNYNTAESETSTIPQIEDDENYNPADLLKNLKIKNINKIILAQLNLNSIRNKFEQLNAIIQKNIDVLVINETKIDTSFPTVQFNIEGFSPPLRMDRPVNGDNGGGTLIYIKEGIPYKILKSHPEKINFEGIFFEINLRNKKWLLFGGYNPDKKDIIEFLDKLSTNLNSYLNRYENILLLGDFNSEIIESHMKDFCDMYAFSNLIKDHTCYKNPENPSSIDMILTNRASSFQLSQTVETGISDYHKMTVTVMKSHFQKKPPLSIRYRSYKHFNDDQFNFDLQGRLNDIENNELDYEIFENTFMNELNKHAPLKTKMVRANNAPFMNSTLSKAVMKRSRLKNIFHNKPTKNNELAYKRYRNYCTNLFKREKRKYYENIDTKQITDNKKFWKTVKPLFSEKITEKRSIILVDDNEIISEDKKVADTLNDFFSNSVKDLNIEGYQTNFTPIQENDDVTNSILKFKDHSSIIKIKELVKIDNKFTFSRTEVDEIEKEICLLNGNKPTTSNSIPAKILKTSNKVCSKHLTKIYNESKANYNFPCRLKAAEITPVHKKDETFLKKNYRPVSILPPPSKIFERNMYNQIYEYMNNHLSPYLCGFRKGFSAQHCLMVMIEKWKKALDKKLNAGAILTDLSKAFDCINYALLIAKLEAYGFDHDSLSYILSYLTNRQQRTKVNNKYSEWSNIETGVPQGSILGPLLFNIYINDIFYFINETDIANYADDNTPYAIDPNVDILIEKLECDVAILAKWFNENYLKLNEDKCHMIITNHSNDLSAMIGNEKVTGSSSVKLLGITIDNKLNFEEHVSNICKKVSLKLHALSRIANHMSMNKLKVIMKAFIESQFSYCPLIWMFHSRQLNNKINKLQERALRIVYKDTQSTFEELLIKDESFTLHQKNLQKLATEMYKINNNLAPSMMEDIFPKNKNPYEMRCNNPFQGFNIRTVKNGSETISFRGPKIWEIVPNDIKNSISLNHFKEQIKKWKPIGCTCRLCKTYIHNLGFI